MTGGFGAHIVAKLNPENSWKNSSEAAAATDLSCNKLLPSFATHQNLMSWKRPLEIYANIFVRIRTGNRFYYIRNLLDEPAKSDIVG